MSDKKLESFKISDKHKPRVKNASAAKAEPAPETQTLGFARIEMILDQEDPGSVADSLSRLHESLMVFDEDAKTPKDKAAAKKARAAVERTVDLLDYLFRTKSAMENSTGKQIQSGKK